MHYYHTDWLSEQKKFNSKELSKLIKAVKRVHGENYHFIMQCCKELDGENMLLRLLLLPHFKPLERKGHGLLYLAIFYNLILENGYVVFSREKYKQYVLEATKDVFLNLERNTGNDVTNNNIIFGLLVNICTICAVYKVARFFLS